MDDFMKEILGTLAKDNGKDFSGQFTFSDTNDCEWVHEAFESKDDAIKEGRKMFPNGFVVGQLKSNGLNYDIVNQEKHSS